MISLQAIDIEMPELHQTRIKKWIQTIIKSYGKNIGELYYLFCSDEYLYKMNITRLNHDFYTDIITFPLNDCNEFLSGEFYISVDRIKENANIFGCSCKDEFHRVMAHGLLHLIGYKDKTDEDAKIMRREEEKCLGMRDLEF